MLTWSRLLEAGRLQVWWGRDPHSAHITDRRQGGGGGSEGAGHRQDEHDDTTTHLGTSLARLLLSESTMRRDRLAAISAAGAGQTRPSVMTPAVAAPWL